MKISKTKKMICGALAVTLLSTSVLAFDYASKTTEESEKRFETFGVINKRNQTFNDDGTITRGKMAEIVGRIQGLSDPHTAVPYEETFLDVDANHPDYLWILVAKNNNWVKGDENSNFRPDDNISEINAVKMLLTTAGYDWMAEKLGGYPIGYKKAAKILFLTEEVGEITEKDITKDTLLKILNRYIELYEVYGGSDVDVPEIRSADEASNSTGQMKDGLRLKLRRIPDIFEE